MINALYRGKRADNGEWVYGYFAKFRNILNEVYCAILPYDKKSGETSLKDIQVVIPETVGQWTGLTDKSGIKIFLGDIVCTRYGDREICCIGDVQFCYGAYGAEWTDYKKNKGMVGSWGQLHNLRRFDDDIINHIEVIGNIHDNFELLD